MAQKKDFDVQEYLNAWNTHDVDRLLEHYADDFEMVDANTGRVVAQGKAALRESVEAVLRAFPDINGDVASAAVGERDVAILTHITGTNTGDYTPPAPQAPYRATGKRVDYALASFFTLDESRKIAREADVMDMALFLKQLGVGEAAAPPAQYGIETGP